MDKKHCAGCYDNFYNTDTKTCWMLGTAELIMRKRVHIDAVPPWRNAPAEYPSCYRQPRYVFLDPTRER